MSTNIKWDVLNGNLYGYWQNSTSFPALPPPPGYLVCFRSWIPEQFNVEIWRAAFLQHKIRRILQNQERDSRHSLVSKLLRGSQSGPSHEKLSLFSSVKSVFSYGDPAGDSHICIVSLNLRTNLRWTCQGKRFKVAEGILSCGKGTLNLGSLQFWVPISQNVLFSGVKISDSL